MKTFPLLMLVPLIASSRSIREAATLVLAAVGVIVLALAPFLIADPHGVSRITHYHSLYGLGGLSLLVQPDLARAWLTGVNFHATGVTHTLQGHAGQAIIVCSVGLASLVVLRRRPRPIDAAVLLWLTVFAFSINWGPRYAVWGLPFLVMAGHIRAALVVQVALLIASVVLYARPVSETAVVWIYI